MAADPDIARRLASALAQGPLLRLALLFGSAAAGALRPESDLDLGIVPVDPDLSLGDELDLQARLCEACGREVEVVRLDRATTLLRWQAAAKGVLVVAHPAHEDSRFRARAAVEHAELRVLRDPCSERYRRQLARRRAFVG